MSSKVRKVSPPSRSPQAPVPTARKHFGRAATCRGGKGDFLTDKELDKLFTATAIGAGDAEVTEGECAAVAAWAHETRLRQFMLDLVLAGTVLPGFREGELVFRGVGADGSPAEAADLRAAFQKIDGRPPKATGNR